MTAEAYSQELVYRINWKACIQGALDFGRRNYTGLLQDVAAAPDVFTHSLFELDLYAWGELDPAVIPANLSENVVHRHLKYPVSALRTCEVIAQMLQRAHIAASCRTSTDRSMEIWE